MFFFKLSERGSFPVLTFQHNSSEANFHFSTFGRPTVLFNPKSIMWCLYLLRWSNIAVVQETFIKGWSFAASEPAKREKKYFYYT